MPGDVITKPAPNVDISAGLTPKTASNTETALREGALGAAEGLGLPESREASDYSLIPGLKQIVTHPVDSAGLIAGSMADAQTAQMKKSGNVGRLIHGLATVNPAEIEAGYSGVKEQGIGASAADTMNLTGGLVPIIGPSIMSAGNEAGEGIRDKDIGKTAHGLASGAAQIATLGLTRKAGAKPEIIAPEKITPKSLPVHEPLTIDAATGEKALPKTEQKLLPAEPDVSPVAHEIAKIHNENGGVTYNLKHGDISHSNNYAVSLFPERSVVIDGELTPDTVQSFMNQNQDLLTDPRANVGTWKSPDGKTYLDVSGTTPVLRSAIDAAKEHNQLSIWDMAAKKEIPTGGTGEALTTAITPADSSRLLSLDPGPEKQPFVGTHYSNARIDEGGLIEGTRRGMADKNGRATGEESLRLSAGRGAPPGVYVYGEGVRAEPIIAGRSNRYRIEGNKAFADINDNPVWQSTLEHTIEQAKKSGENDTQAIKIGINEAEHALKAAGYDGYYHGDRPGTYFLFGDQKVAGVKSSPTKRISPFTDTASHAATASK